jgi:hypothetical protein
VVVCLRDLGDGSSRLIFDDVVAESETNPTAWRFEPGRTQCVICRQLATFKPSVASASGTTLVLAAAKPTSSLYSVERLSMTAIAFAQGIYYVATGSWSIVHIDSFQKVTGPKTDLWLVKTVGALLVAIGAGLILTAVNGQFDPGLILIAIASAAVLLAIDLIYVSKRIISPVYVLDATAEVGLIAWWVLSVYR